MNANHPQFIYVSVLLGTLGILVMIGCHPKNLFKPFDVVANPVRNPNVDDNGFLINPLWGQQLMNGKESFPNKDNCAPSGPDQDDPGEWEKCTDIAVTTNRGAVCGPHVNFIPVHYESVGSWSSHSGNDDDFNITFQADDLSLHSVQSPDGIVGEFDSDETTKHFKTEWWKKFHDAGQNDGEDVRTMVNGKKMIAIGLLGLDCAFHLHQDCPVELHPVYILAMRVDSTGPNVHWVFFARNEGNQGFCSNKDQHLPPTTKGFQYSILLPNKTARGFAFSKEDVLLYFNGSSSPAGEAYKSEFIRGQGMKLTFSLADPEQLIDENSMVIEGDLEITWF